MESTYMELFITFLYPRVRDTSPRPRGYKNYPELPCELTEKLTGTAPCAPSFFKSGFIRKLPILHQYFTFFIRGESY